MAQAINLQITPSNVMPKIYASQFDIGREIEISLYDGASAYTPPVGTDIRFEGKKPDGNGFSYACTYTGNVVTVVATDQMTVLAGEIPCELRMSLNGDDIGTLNIIFVIEKSPIDENVPISDTEIPAIVELARDEQYNAEAWAIGERNGVPVGPTDPQYHNNAKYWAEHAEYGALDALTDVEITTPTNGDLLQYNSADDEWVNSSDVWATMAQNGAHNLWDIAGWASRLNQSYTKSGNTYTFSYVSAFYDNPYVFSDTNIDVVVSGTVGSAENIKARVGLYNAAGQRVARSEFDTSFSISGSGCKIVIEYNTNGQWSITEGMIRLATDPVTDYMPYAPINRDCMSYAVNSKLGAHNLCPNKAVALTNNEVTFTIDSNKVITATISSTTQGNRYLTWHTYTPMKKGRYKLSGCSDGTKGIIFCTKSDNSAHWASNRGGVTEFDITEDITDLFMQVRIDQGVTAGTVKFSVMITAVEDTDTTYTPYAMTNRELTPQILYNQNNIYICKQGKIVVAQFNGAKPSDIASLNFASLGAKPIVFTSSFQCKCDAKPTTVEINANGTVANVGYYASYGATYTDLKSDTSKNVYGSICFVSE